MYRENYNPSLDHITKYIHKYEEFEFLNFTKRRREKKKKGRRLNLPDVLAAVQRGEVVGVLWTLFGFGEDREVGTEQQILHHTT